MPLIRGLIDRAILVGGALCSGTAPSFIVQYRQRVGGHLEQVSRSLSPWRDIADKLHEGSLDALVQHHLNSTDPTFHAEGAAIQAMINDERALRLAVDSLSGDLQQQLWYIVWQSDAEILKATWAEYQPSFAFSFESLVLAVVSGILLSASFVVLWTIVARIASARRGV